MDNVGTTSGSEWATSAAPDDFVCILLEINFLSKEVCGNYIEHVVKLLSSCSADILDVVKQNILQGGKSLNDLAPLAVKAITDVLVDDAVENLRQVKGVTATYRITYKPLLVRHSPYVSGVLQPLKVILDGERAMTYLTKETRNESLHGATTDITSCYYELAAELVNVQGKLSLHFREYSDACRAPPLAPRLTGLTETCSGAPLNSTVKSRVIDLGLCRKLEF